MQPSPLHPSAHRALGSSFSSARLQQSRTEPNPFSAAAQAPGSQAPGLADQTKSTDCRGFKSRPLCPVVNRCRPPLAPSRLSLPPNLYSLCVDVTCASVSLDVQLPAQKTVLPTKIAIPTSGLVVCLPASLPAWFCLSCIFVGRSSQLTQLNESSRFARFGVLRRSPKARGTGSQSLQASMRPLNSAQPWNILPPKPCLRTTADGRSAPVPLPSLKTFQGLPFGPCVMATNSICQASR